MVLTELQCTTLPIIASLHIYCIVVMKGNKVARYILIADILYNFQL